MPESARAPAPMPGRQGGEQRHLFFRMRVAVLLGVLATVIVYAVRDHWSRSARRDWQRPLEIALVLLERGALDADALARFQARVPELERALEREFSRHGGRFRPFRFRRFGPV